jgi:hypothetical protein
MSKPPNGERPSQRWTGGGISIEEFELAKQKMRGGSGTTQIVECGRMLEECGLTTRGGKKLQVRT